MKKSEILIQLNRELVFNFNYVLTKSFSMKITSMITFNHCIYLLNNIMIAHYLAQYSYLIVLGHKTEIVVTIPF